MKPNPEQDADRAAFEKWYAEKYGTRMFCQNRWEGWQAAKADNQAKYAALIHWPDCWDTSAYPTLESALREIGCNPEYCTVRAAQFRKTGMIVPLIEHEKAPPEFIKIGATP